MPATWWSERERLIDLDYYVHDRGGAGGADTLGRSCSSPPTHGYRRAEDPNFVGLNAELTASAIARHQINRAMGRYGTAYAALNQMTGCNSLFSRDVEVLLEAPRAG